MSKPCSCVCHTIDERTAYCGMCKSSHNPTPPEVPQELKTILNKYFTGEQYDELRGTFIRIPFTKQMASAGQAILNWHSTELKKEKLEARIGGVERLAVQLKLAFFDDNNLKDCIDDEAIGLIEKLKSSELRKELEKL